MKTKLAQKNEMNKYNITINYDGVISYEIEAANDIEAKQKAELLFKKEEADILCENIYNTEIEVEETEAKQDESSQDFEYGIRFTYENSIGEFIGVRFGEVEEFIKAVDFEDPSIESEEDISTDLSAELDSNIIDVKLGSKEEVILEDIKDVRSLYEALAEKYGPQKNKRYEVELFSEGVYTTSLCIIAFKKPTAEEATELLFDKMGDLGCDTISGIFNLPYPDFEAALDFNDPGGWIVYGEIEQCIPFGDECEITKPKGEIDCSELGYFDELEYQCMELVKEYADTFGLQIYSTIGNDEPMSFDIAKEVQETILNIFEKNGIKLNTFSEA